MSGKHKYSEKSRVWRKEENIRKLDKRERKQKPDPTVKDEWKIYQIRRGKGEEGERTRGGTTATLVSYGG